MQLSFGRRYCVVLGEAEWLTQPATYGRELADWALAKLNITAATSEETP